MRKILYEKTKKIELRGSKCKLPIGTTIYIGKKGSSHGKVLFDGCIGPLTLQQLEDLKESHCVEDITKIHYKKVYGWLFKNPELFDSNLTYTHKKGAQMWVRT